MASSGNKNWEDIYGLIPTKPLDEAYDGERKSRLAEQAERDADIIRCHFAALPQSSPEEKSPRERGMAMTIFADRGDGKSTFINFIKARLNGSNNEQTSNDSDGWIWVDINWEIVETARSPRPEALVFLGILESLRDKKHKTILADAWRRHNGDNGAGREGGTDSEKQGGVDSTPEGLDCLLKQLEKEVGAIGMGDETASQAALAFATDRNDFARIYTEMSQNAGFAVQHFADLLAKILMGARLKLGLVIDDCDLLGDCAVPMLLATLQLCEKAPVLRLAAMSPAGARCLMRDRFKNFGAEEQGWAWLRLVGHENSISPMNDERKLKFLCLPEPEPKPKPKPEAPESEQGETLLDGRLIWGEVLHSEELTVRNLPEEDLDTAKQRFEMVSLELIAVVNIKTGSKLKARTFFSHLLEGHSLPTFEDEPQKKRKKYLELFLELLPSNRRAMVATTNLLIRLRKQKLQGRKEHWHDIAIPWDYFSCRMITFLITLAYVHWPTTILAEFLWQSPMTLANAFNNKKVKVSDGNNGVHKVTVKPESEFRDLGDELRRFGVDVVNDSKKKSPKDLTPEDRKTGKNMLALLRLFQMAAEDHKNDMSDHCCPVN